MFYISVVFANTNTQTQTHIQTQTNASASPKGKNTSLNICFLSLNNPYEYKTLKKFIDERINPYSSKKINVIEFLDFADYADVAFAKILRSNTACHGLVISGHHRQNGFEGYRAVGLLNYSFLKKVRCQPAFRSFFHGVNVLWLQGCATSSQNEEKTENSFAALEYRNSFAFRYAKLFPQATYLGWSGSAPSQEAPKTIPYQIVNLLGKKNGGDPVSGGYTIENAKAYAAATVAMLEGKNPNTQQAWKKVGMGDRKQYYSIFNRTIQAFPRLQDSFPEISATDLVRKTELLCENDWPTILSEPISIAMYIEEIFAQREYLAKRYKLSPTILSFLKSRAQANDAILEHRLIYYSFYLALLQTPTSSSGATAEAATTATALTEELRKATIEALNKPKQKLDSVERKHHFEHLAEVALVGFSTSQPLLRSTDLAALKNADAIAAILQTIVKNNPPNAGNLLALIAKNPHTRGENLHFAVVQLRLRKQKIPQFSQLLASLAQHPHLMPKTKKLLDVQ